MGLRSVWVSPRRETIISSVEQDPSLDRLLVDEGADVSFFVVKNFDDGFFAMGGDPEPSRPCSPGLDAASVILQGGAPSRRQGPDAKGSDDAGMLWSSAAEASSRASRGTGRAGLGSVRLYAWRKLVVVSPASNAGGPLCA